MLSVQIPNFHHEVKNTLEIRFWYLNGENMFNVDRGDFKRIASIETFLL